MWPDQLDVIIAEAHRRGLAALGEPGFTAYPYAIRAGIDALPRNDHYQMELAPALAKLIRADEPSAGADAYHALCAIAPDSNEVLNYGKQLATSHTALMPTLALEATADSLDVSNPWSARSSDLIAPADLDIPVDQKTGASGFLASVPAERRGAIVECGWHKEKIDAQLFRLGAKFLAGSSATSYGVMPGSGLHVELVLLHRIGLSPREAIAAATTNFAEVYGWNDVGRIEAGRIADLLILDEDPRLRLSALDSIESLILNGTVVDRDRLLDLKTTQ
ncbi:MAG: amidohydrolase family protein [Terracidiphilus sp.]